MPLPQTPHGHLTAFCIIFCHSPLIITLVLFIFRLMPLFSTSSFYSLSLLIRSSSVSAITTKYTYNNSYSKVTPNSLDKSFMTITNSTHTHTHTSILQPSGLCPGLPGWTGTRTNLDFTEARDSEWQWHQTGHMQSCTSPQTDNHASTPPLSSLQAWWTFPPPNQQHQSTESNNHK